MEKKEIKMAKIDEKEMEIYLMECEDMFDYVIGEIYRIGDEHKAVESELALELCRRIKEHFNLK